MRHILRRLVLTGGRNQRPLGLVIADPHRGRDAIGQKIHC